MFKVIYLNVVLEISEETAAQVLSEELTRPLNFDLSQPTNVSMFDQIAASADVDSFLNMNMSAISLVGSITLPRDDSEVNRENDFHGKSYQTFQVCQEKEKQVCKLSVLAQKCVHFGYHKFLIKIK